MVTIDSQLSAVVSLAGVSFVNVRVTVEESSLDGPLAEVEHRLRTAPISDDMTKAVRQMYRRCRIDPTKTRPSSEALLRRVRRGDSLPRVNSIVDVCNWCSVESQIPFGLYDLDNMHPPIDFRMGREGEAYAGIRKEVIHVANRPVLVDGQGPFGNPTSDSARTMVRNATTNVLIVIFLPVEVEPARRTAILDIVSERGEEFTGAKLEQRWGA